MSLSNIIKAHRDTMESCIEGVAINATVSRHLRMLNENEGSIPFTYANLIAC